MRSAGVNFIDQIFNADDSEFSEGSLDDLIGSKRDSLLVDLSVSSLVDHFRDGGSSGESESDKRLDLLDHVEGGSVDSDKGGVVDLSKSEQLEDLFDLRSQMVDTSDSDDKDGLGFSGNEERSAGSGGSLLGNEVFFFSNGSLVVSFRSLGIFSFTQERITMKRAYL
jgi:hypothetical protein